MAFRWMSGLINHLYLRNFKTFGKGLMRSADMNERRQPARPAIVDGFLPLWVLFPLEDLQAPMVLTGTLRNWNPRPACGTAISSVRISTSVFGLVPTRDEPVECLEDPSNGCLSLFPLLWKRKCPQRAADGLRRKKLDVCLIFGIPGWLMPLRDRSGQSSQPFRQGAR